MVSIKKEKRRGSIYVVVRNDKTNKVITTKKDVENKNIQYYRSLYKNSNSLNPKIIKRFDLGNSQMTANKRVVQYNSYKIVKPIKDTQTRIEYKVVINGQLVKSKDGGLYRVVGFSPKGFKDSEAKGRARSHAKYKLVADGVIKGTNDNVRLIPINTSYVAYVLE